VCEEALAVIPGGRGLDAATGRVGFVGTLRSYLQSHADIVAVDVSEGDLKYAEHAR